MALSLIPAFFSQYANAEYEPEQIIKYRKNAMTAIKGHNNSIKAIIEGKVPFNDQLDMHMTSLEALFNNIGTLFPEGSDFGETNAKDEIWDNPEKFSKAVDQAKQAFADFKKAASKGDSATTQSAFKEFGKSSCGNCHKAFRKKEE